VNRPAPRIVSAIEDLAAKLHPEAFVEKPATSELEPRDPGEYKTDAHENAKLASACVR
jgi:hypothetical protein